MVFKQSISFENGFRACTLKRTTLRGYKPQIANDLVMKDVQAPGTQNVKIAKPFMSEEVVKTVEGILRSGMLVQGKFVKEFETKLAQYIGAKHVVAVNSGTAALHVSILAVIESGRWQASTKDPEVVTTPLSFAATANAALHAGCKPVFADVDPQTFNIDPAKAKERISERTIAIEPVDVYRPPADLGKINSMARSEGIAVVEDAAEAIGASFEGKKIGTISDLTCFSTYATKNLHTGEGGFVTTNDDELAQSIEMIRSQGQASQIQSQDARVQLPDARDFCCDRNTSGVYSRRA